MDSSSRVLVHADRIRIGCSMFVYLEHPDDEVDRAILNLTPAEQEWDRAAGGAERTASYEAPRRTVIQAFMRISASINGIRDADEIQSRVSELIFQVIPAQQVAILLVG